MRVLICSDGSFAAEQAAEMVARLNYAPDTEITLLGVSVTDGDQGTLSDSFKRMEMALVRTYPGIQKKIRYGPASGQIIEETEEHPYDLVAIGASGIQRGRINLRTGATAKKLARLVRTPILVVRNVPEKVKRVLICTAAEAPSKETLLTGGALIATSGAEIGLLHVMSQLALRLDSPPDDLLDTATSAIQRHTREGKHLEFAQQVLQQAGVSGPINPRLRHGLVIDEVLAEVEEGNYDILVIGRHYQHGGNRWLDMLLEDVTGQLLSGANCSVLIV